MQNTTQGPAKVTLCRRQEVPRMLYEAEQMDQLATYINEMHDPELLCWWGKYNESLGHSDIALQSYQQANDIVAIVRLHCQQEDFVAACEVVESSNNAAAAFMLARQLEATEQVRNPSHTALTLLCRCFDAAWHKFRYLSLAFTRRSMNSCTLLYVLPIVYICARTAHEPPAPTALQVMFYVVALDVLDKLHGISVSACHGL